MAYSQALEEQFGALAHMHELRRTDGANHGAAEREIEEILEAGETYYWAPQLCEVIQQAAGDLPGTWQWHPEMLPTREGFVWFAKPIHFDWFATEGDMGEPLPPVVLAAIGWGSGRNNNGSLAVNVVGFAPGEHHIMPLLILQLRHGQSIADRMADESSLKLEGRYFTTGSTMFSVFGACLSFLEQRVFVTPQRRAERHARRRLERQGYVHEPVIRVVELRRKQAKSEHSSDHESVEWSHQWVVSGHWRNQWYPSLNAHQPRWILPYVKGPEDAPLKPPRAKVFAVVR